MENSEAKDSYSHVLKYTGIFGGVQGLNIVIGLVRNKLIALLLGPSGMGLASLFNSSINFVSQATNLGISFSAVKNISEVFDKGDEKRLLHIINMVRGWAIITALLGILVCMVAGPLLSDYTFSWGNHTLHYVLLAPAVGLIAITGGETAILKGTRRLRSLAVIQIYSVIASLAISIPLYFFFGQSAIVPVIVLMAAASMIFTIGYSYKFYPLRLKGTSGILGEGMGMVRLGVAFVLAGVMGSGAEMLIRSYLNVVADLETVGLYNAGFVLTVTYASMVFSAMETDYFPRLSAVNNNRDSVNLIVNRQIEVSLLIVSPMLASLIIALPVLMPLLNSGEFMPVVGMAQVAVFSMYLKAVSLPVAYVTLAKGDSVAYLILEAIYDVLLVLLIIYGYSHWGLWGTGLALSVSYLLDMILIFVYARLRYGFVMSRQVVCYMLVMLPIGGIAYAITLMPLTWIYWLLGFIVCIINVALSCYILSKKASLWSSLTSKIKSRFRHG